MPRLSRRAVILVAIGAVALASTGSAAAATWSRTATAVPASAHVFLPSLSLAVDRRDSSVFAWSPRGSAHSRILTRVRGAGGGLGPVQLVVPDRINGAESAAFGKVVADSLGGATLLWEKGAGYDLYAAQRQPGKFFGANTSIGPGLEANAIAVDDAGALRLLATGLSGKADHAYLIERPAGQGFTPPRDLGPEPSPEAAIGPRGDVAVVNNYYDLGPHPPPGETVPILVAVRAAGSPSLGPLEPTGLTGTAKDPSATTLAVGPDGSVAVMQSSSTGVRISVRPPGGHFGAPQRLDARAGIATALRYGRKGDLIAAWAIRGSQERGSIRGALAGPGGHFGPTHTLATNAWTQPPNGGAGGLDLQIVTSRDGSALIGWTARTHPRVSLWTVRRRHGHSFERATSVMSIYAAAYPFAIAGGDSRFAAAAVSPFDHSVHTRTEPSG